MMELFFKLHQCYCVKNFKFQGMQSRRLIAIDLQNTNAVFHKIVYRHYSGDVEKLYITLQQI